MSLCVLGSIELQGTEEAEAQQGRNWHQPFLAFVWGHVLHWVARVVQAPQGSSRRATLASRLLASPMLQAMHLAHTPSPSAATGMNACVGVGAVAEAQTLLERVAAAGEGADPRAYNILLKHHSRAGDTAALPGLLARMAAAGARPSAVSYNTLIDAYARGGATDEARREMGRAVAAGVRLDAWSYTSLVGGRGPWARCALLCWAGPAAVCALSGPRLGLRPMLRAGVASVRLCVCICLRARVRAAGSCIRLVQRWWCLGGTFATPQSSIARPQHCLHASARRAGAGVRSKGGAGGGGGGAIRHASGRGEAHCGHLLHPAGRLCAGERHARCAAHAGSYGGSRHSADGRYVQQPAARVCGGGGARRRRGGRAAAGAGGAGEHAGGWVVGWVVGGCSRSTHVGGQVVGRAA